MGEVYEAEDLQMERSIALKTVRADFLANGQMLVRFKREIRLAQRITHRNVCRIYDLGSHPSSGNGRDTVFFTMELLRGETLTKRLLSGPLAEPEALLLAAQIASGLEAAHREHIVHGDFKTGNVIIVDSSEQRAVITDFGLAFSSEETGLQTEFATAGTPEYMAPEQIEGLELTVATDIYAFGIVLYEMVTGQKPFSGSGRAAILKRLSEPPVSPRSYAPKISPIWEHTILRCLARHPGDRFQNVEQVSTALRNGVTAAVRADAPTTPMPNLRSGRPRLLIRVLAAAACVCGIAALLWSLEIGRSGKPSAQAARWYEEGNRALRDGNSVGAMTALERCVALDSGFPLCHALLAQAASELGYLDKSKTELLRASTAGQRLFMPRDEQLHIDAVYCVVMKDYPCAIAKYRKLIDVAPRLQKAGFLVDLGHVYETSGDVKQAFQSYNQSLTLDRQYAAAFLRLSELYRKQHRLDEAMAELQEAETLYRSENNIEGLTQILYQRGTLLNKTGRMADAAPQLTESLKLAQESGNDYLQIRALLQLSNNAYMSGRTEEGEQQAQQAAELANRTGLEALAASGWVDVGNAFWIRGDYGHSEHYLRMAAELAKRYQAPFIEARADVSLGGVLLDEDRADEASPFLRRADEFFEHNGYRSEAAQTLIPLGKALQKKGDYRSALETFQRELNLAQLMHNRLAVALGEDAIGGVFADQENYPAALAHFEESVKINQQMKDQLGVAYSSLKCARMLFDLGHFAEAQVTLNGVLPVAKTVPPVAVGMDEALAEMAMLRQEWNQAQHQADQAINLLHGSNEERAGELKLTRALANALSGRSQAEAQCAAAAPLASKAPDPSIQRDAQLRLARCQLAAGDARQALSTAAALIPQFAADKQLHSEFQSNAICAVANAKLGDREKAREYCKNAEATLETLQHSWNANDWGGYLSRPDVTKILSQIHRVCDIR